MVQKGLLPYNDIGRNNKFKYCSILIPKHTKNQVKKNQNLTCSKSYQDSQLLSPITPNPPLYRSQLAQSSKSSTVLFTS